MDVKTGASTPATLGDSAVAAAPSTSSTRVKVNPAVALVPPPRMALVPALGHNGLAVPASPKELSRLPRFEDTQPPRLEDAAALTAAPRAITARVHNGPVAFSSPEDIPGAEISSPKTMKNVVLEGSGIKTPSPFIPSGLVPLLGDGGACVKDGLVTTGPSGLPCHEGQVLNGMAGSVHAEGIQDLRLLRSIEGCSEQAMQPGGVEASAWSPTLETMWASEEL